MESTKQQVVATLDDFLYGWEFRDIEKASFGGSKLGAFILAACFIDAMAGFHAGIDKEQARSKSGERFKAFVTTYLTQYDAEKLWKDLRCGLVHAFASGESYSFVDAKPWLHKAIHDGKELLNLENFIGDVRAAYCKLRSDILMDDKAFERAKRTISTVGLMGWARPIFGSSH
jgi:hypothetical protein